MDDQSITQSKTTKPTILVIEDNTDDLFVIRWTLQQQFPDVEVVWLSDAAQVDPYLDSCLQPEKGLPRLILLDLYLPSAKVGLAILQHIKSHLVYKQIPTVLLSRSRDPDDVAEALTFSANSYMVKPASMNDWLESFTLLQTYW